MEQDFSELQKRWSEMSRDEFAQVKKRDLRKELLPLYDSEKKRRASPQFQAQEAAIQKELELQRIRSEQGVAAKIIFGGVFSGRVSRKNFLLGFLAYLVVVVVLLSMIFVYVGLIANRLPRTSPPPNDLEKVLFYLSIALLNIVFILLFYSLSIRRLHDLDKTGWWVLLSGIPMVNVGMFIWLLLAKGREKVNRYGKPDSARIVPALFNLTYRNER